MFARLAFVLALPMAAIAQIHVFYIPASGTPQEITDGAQCNLGSFAAGETFTLHFQVQGETDIPIVNIQTGQYFTLASALPTAIPPNGTVDFYVSFTAPGPPAPVVPESALLTVDSFSTLLVAYPVAMPTLGDGTGATWLPGDVIGFAQTQVGRSVTKSFELIKPYPNAITISSFSVTGAAFQTSAVTMPLTLAANATQPFQITFAPTIPDTNSGSLIVNGQSFGLSGQGFQPPLPAATIQITGATTSAQQPTLAIQLASPAQSGGTGTLTMTFTPSGDMPDDPAVQFADTGGRTITVQVKEGDTFASCGAGPDCTFQTGTTAGTISFVLSLGNQAAQASVPIVPAVVTFDTETASVQGSGIQVTLAGFDNTQSASNFSFTFYDANGKEIPGGVIAVDGGPQFTQFFKANAAQTGGLFQMQAVFPVNGSIGEIAKVSVTAANTAGTSAPVQLAITE